MIPAILSCVYVIYLYRTLNAPASEHTTDAQSESLSDRVSRIQSRIDSLTKESKS
ncbi:hypothetical protein Poly51_13480 [Rubripirellula tenax]|uniref:Uncharacterized protein n=1 Tax=Rubripirellula tenax TaxID=2528015 RepID=A0A5C6FFZ8_9BACT|nr:hypothetical protein [Rubripirellula tenax]TWU58569.1 hypothetical protein Poly51_13480 [Rubripirellula tenax]